MAKMGSRSKSHLRAADITARAVRHFGTTANPNEAGYILPNGTMLDFSGRHEAGGYLPDYLRGSRNVDHREVYDIVGVGGTEGMLLFMARAGAVRCHFSHVDWIAVETIAPMTGHQIAAILRALNGRSITAERVDAEGRTLNVYEADFPLKRDVKTRLESL